MITTKRISGVKWKYTKYNIKSQKYTYELHIYSRKIGNDVVRGKEGFRENILYIFMLMLRSSQDVVSEHHMHSNIAAVIGLHKGIVSHIK